jgi:hypothetical protein
VDVFGDRRGFWLRNLLNSKRLSGLRRSHPRCTKGVYAPFQRRMMIEIIIPIPKGLQ